MSESVFAKLDDYELDGMPFWAEAFRRENPVALTTSIPINIDNLGGIDLFVQNGSVVAAQRNTKTAFSSQFFYQVMSNQGQLFPHLDKSASLGEAGMGHVSHLVQGTLSRFQQWTNN